MKKKKKHWASVTRSLFQEIMSAPAFHVGASNVEWFFIQPPLTATTDKRQTNTHFCFACHSFFHHIGRCMCVSARATDATRRDAHVSLPNSFSIRLMSLLSYCYNISTYVIVFEHETRLKCPLVKMQYGFCYVLPLDVQNDGQHSFLLLTTRVRKMPLIRTAFHVCQTKLKAYQK